MTCGTDCGFWKPPSGLMVNNGQIIGGWTAKCLVGFCYLEDKNGDYLREEEICIIGDDCYFPTEYEFEIKNRSKCVEEV